MRAVRSEVWKKSRIGIVALAASGMLCACGDDLSVQIPVDYRDLAEPIGTVGAANSESEQITVPDILEGEKIPQGEESDETASRDDAAGDGDGTGGIDETETLPEEESEPSVVSLTISATGDVTLGTHHQQDYGFSFRQTYDEAETDDYFFENVHDIFSADDMTIVNLEGVLTHSEDMLEGQTYNIKGDPEYVNLLTSGSVEAAAMGNNHRLDYGKQGSDDTVEALEDAGIVYAYDENVGIYETKGIRIGFVSVNEVYWGSGVEKDMQAGIEKLKEEGVDLILACCHWGTERENYPENYQRTLGKKCIDWGADLVIGHHPHVLQGVEEYQGKFIIYSLGNFCFGANRNPEDKDCMIFQQTFTFVDGEKQEDQKIRMIPCSVSSVKNRNDFKPTPLEGGDGQRVIDRVNTYSKDYGVEFAEDGTLVEVSE